MQIKSFALTVNEPGHMTTIHSVATLINAANKISRDVVCLWDTGAHICMMSKSLYTSLGFNFVNKRKVIGAVESVESLIGMTTVRLCVNGVDLEVEAGVLPDSPGLEDQFIVGMNVISLGEFHFSFKDGMSCFSFRIPAKSKIDCVAEALNRDPSCVTDTYNQTDNGEIEIISTGVKR